MAILSFESAMSTYNANEGNNNSGVSYFSLKNDGEFALVRFDIEKVEDIVFLSSHSTKINNRFLDFNCLRNDTDMLEACPACAGNMKRNIKAYLRMLQYVQDEQGNISVKPVVWNRSLSFAIQIKDLIMTYGDLRNHIFKITRNGNPGDLSTTYSILYCPEQMCPQVNYPYTAGLFNNFSELGTHVSKKSYDEIKTFMDTGIFPITNNNNSAQVTNSAAQSSMPFPTTPQPQAVVPPTPAPAPVSSMPFDTSVPNSMPATNAVPPWQAQTPWSTSEQQAVQRPIRTY